jgi:Flp pilus assembly protein TadG
MSRLVRRVTRALLPIRRPSGALIRDERASVAAEFGILAIPFFAIIGAICETSMCFFAGQVLDSAVQDATRQIRTGQAQTSGYTATTFKNLVCSGLYGLFNCNNLKVKVSVISTFGSAATTVTTTPYRAGCDPNPPPPATPPADGCWNVTETYSAGTGSSIVLVEAYYQWPVMVNLGGFNLANQSNGSRLLAAVRVFRNEPFG